jgi:serralysin
MLSNSSESGGAVLSDSPGFVAVTTGGITINLLFDAAAMAAPASFRAAIQQAATMLTAAISDQITVNLTIDYSGTGGGAGARPDNGLYESYSSIRADLINSATLGDTTFNALPSGASIQGQSLVAVWNAQLKALGLLSPTAATDDGYATFATNINPNLLVGVALHELTHALGRYPWGTPLDPVGRPDIFDLFRFTSPGARLFQSSATAPAAYFSVDGGFTKLADYGQNSDSSDFLNSGVQGPNDPFNEFYTGNTNQQLTTVDLRQLDALGFHLTSYAPVVIEAVGLTSLIQASNTYFLYPVGGSGGPQLRFSGAPVTVGQNGPWMPIAAEQTASGYEVAWKAGSADQYLVWNIDGNGNYVSSVGGVMSGNSLALEALEPSFHQDLNSDGTIGPPATTQLATDFGNVGTLGSDTTIASGLGTETVGNVGPGGGSVALLTNYIASTFATPAAEGTGAVAATQPSAQDILTRPAA